MLFWYKLYIYIYIYFISLYTWLYILSLSFIICLHFRVFIISQNVHENPNYSILLSSLISCLFLASTRRTITLLTTLHPQSEHRLNSKGRYVLQSRTYVILCSFHILMNNIEDKVYSQSVNRYSKYIEPLVNSKCSLIKYLTVVRKKQRHWT